MRSNSTRLLILLYDGVEVRDLPSGDRVGRIRNVERELPDAVIEAKEEPLPVEGEPQAAAA